MSERLGELIGRLAYLNSEIWHAEERARANDYAEAREWKPVIDKLNQRRNDAIEAIDRLVATWKL